MVNCPGKFTADAAAAKRGFGNPLPGGKSPGKFGNRRDDAAAAAAAAAAATAAAAVLVPLLVLVV